MTERKSLARAARIAPGVVIDRRYRIESHLGEGGMGTVLVAAHVELGRRVALKVLQDRVGEDPSMRKRFEREARTLAAMSHPNIVALNDYGIWEGTPYLVMELLEGRTLRDLLDAERLLPVERALAITQQVLRALSYAHGEHVIHRDLKPGNVFLQALPDQIDHVKLLDFGFAKFVNAPSTAFVSNDGIVVGTPAYMAPEQAGGAVDRRADVYSTGVLLFEMLTGRRPFEGTPLEMIRGRMSREAPPLREVRPDLDVPELEQAIAHALARSPSDRPETAAAMSAELAPLGARLVPAPPRRTSRRPQTSAPPPAGPTSAKTMELASGDLEDHPPGRAARPRAAAPKAAARPRDAEPSGALKPIRRKGPLKAPKAPQSAPRPRRVSRLWLAIAILSIAGVAYAAWWATRPEADAELDPLASLESAGSTGSDEPPPVAASRSPSGPPRATDEPTSPSPAPATAPTRPAVAEPTVATLELVDPWSREIPSELLALRARIEGSAPPSPGDLQRVGRYARLHPDDARALALLAHGYVRVRWMGEAFDRYVQAHAVDPEVRGDPHMLEDLLALSQSPSIGPRARELVIAVYGRDALAALDLTLGRGDLTPAASARLRTLREGIVARP